MSLTIAIDTARIERISRNLGMICGTIAFDSSYPTGGESASGITGYFTTCYRIICDAKSGYIFEWDKTNSKIIVRYPTDFDASANAIAPEVGNTVNLSSLTGVSFIAIGLI
jgi:hypothetical protein